MILAIVRALGKPGKRTELEQAAEAFCRGTAGCVEHDLYVHPVNETALMSLSKWRGEQPSGRGGPADDELVSGFVRTLTPLSVGVEIELHTVSPTMANATETETRTSSAAATAMPTAEDGAEPTSIRPATTVRFTTGTNRFAPSEPPPGEEKVQVVERYIRDHLYEDLTIADLASIACVSPRTLFRNFRRLGRKSPMKVLEAARLEHTRARLFEGKTGDTVTRIAADSGFTHLGRFSALYRQTFGESPSSTLRSSQLRELKHEGAKEAETSKATGAPDPKWPSDTMDWDDLPLAKLMPMRGVRVTDRRADAAPTGRPDDRTRQPNYRRNVS